MDVLREAFGYPFMELAHPTGRKKLVSKEGPQAGAAYGIELAGLLCPQYVYISKVMRLPVQTHLEDEKIRIANPHPLPWSGIPPGWRAFLPIG